VIAALLLAFVLIVSPIPIASDPVTGGLISASVNGDSFAWVQVQDQLTLADPASRPEIGAFSGAYLGYLLQAPGGNFLAGELQVESVDKMASTAHRFSLVSNRSRELAPGRYALWIFTDGSAQLGPRIEDSRVKYTLDAVRGGHSTLSHQQLRGGASEVHAAWDAALNLSAPGVVLGALANESRGPASEFDRRICVGEAPTRACPVGSSNQEVVLDASKWIAEAAVSHTDPGASEWNVVTRSSGAGITSTIGLAFGASVDPAVWTARGPGA
jgi:hypothetical protein